MAKQFAWAALPLGSEDQKLISAYEKISKPLDVLPYSEEFDSLLRDIEIEPTDENKRRILHRLMNLRKRAWLPRTSTIVNAESEQSPLAADDEELVSGYGRTGRSLDSLPFTDEFDQLIRDLGKPNTDAVKHAVFQRLLRLRKRGRLPSI
jgi:hypothetical protein